MRSPSGDQRALGFERRGSHWPPLVERSELATSGEDPDHSSGSATVGLNQLSPGRVFRVQGGES